MLKKFIAGAASVLLILISSAGRGIANNSNIGYGFSDTADKKEVLVNDSAKALEDPKQEFRDLFNTVSSSSGVSLQQLNPQAVSFVEDYIEKNADRISDLKDWGKPYLDKMESILVQHGLPKELKYLAVIESNLKSSARSWAGAVGPWQFMPETARKMGLKVGAKYDERKDLVKSSHAASKYLNDLFAIYGDWLLVIAAYNGGAGKVNSAIKKSGSRDFWTLQRYLPKESKNHVKKFIATHYIMEGQGSIATVTKEEARNLVSPVSSISPEALAGSKTQSISGRYNSLVIAKHVTMDIAAFNKFNPDFDKQIASGNSYDLRLPGDKMDMFLAKKPEILNESVQLLLNGTTSGETSRR
jgi:peptidoglycan lytic transglycosylase D